MVLGLPFHRCAVVLAVLLMTPSMHAQNADSTRVIEAEDFFDLRQVGSPVISPDGDWVAYTIRETSLEEDSSETRLWMATIDGSENIAMSGVGSSVNSPAWSPDGKYLTFLSSRNEGESQVWALNRRGGEAVALTDIETGVNGYSWSPDSSKLLLEISDEELGVEEDDDKPKPWVIDRLQFKRDYAGYLDRLRTHLFLFDLSSTDKTNATQLTFGDYDDSEPAWSPDSSKVAFVSNRTEEPDANGNTDVWVVDVANPEQGLTQVTQNEGSDGSPSWSSDGRWLTYETVTQPELIWYATTHLGVASAAGGSERVLTSRLDRNVSTPRFAANSSDSILFMLEDSGERHLASIDRSGENFARPIAGQQSLRGYSIGPNGEVASLIGRSNHPAEIFVGESDNLLQISSANDDVMATFKLASVENVEFESEDGTLIEGFIYKPPGFDSSKRYPTLLRIHGGPVSQYDFNFNFEAQLFAANGYVVVMTNPRGSSGYGQDFSHALWSDWGNKDFQDVSAGIDHAIELGYADPNKLGVGGWSYGGILTNYVITKTDRFQGAITGASEVLYRSNYGHDHYQRQWEAELGLPWETPENWERISPFNDVANVTTATLVMGGEKDWNVPILNSEQLYQALKRLGVDTQLVVYPNEHHGIRLPSFQLDRFQRYLNWYDAKVKRSDD